MTPTNPFSQFIQAVRVLFFSGEQGQNEDPCTGSCVARNFDEDEPDNVSLNSFRGNSSYTYYYSDDENENEVSYDTITRRDS